MKTTKTIEKEPKKEPKKEKLKTTKPVLKAESKKPVKKDVKDMKPEKYMESTGKRKRAIARIRIFTKGKKEILINGKPCKDYFYTSDLEQIATDSLRKMKSLDKFRVLAVVKGGGISAQAEAVRHGIAKILVDFNPDFRKRLRKAGFLTRDPRKRERKKFGLKRARRAPQWQKR
jgi:small subunit ribosomal protein S9